MTLQLACADTHPCSRVYLGWPTRLDNWRLGAKPAREAVAQLASLLTNGTPSSQQLDVLVAAPTKAAAATARGLLDARVSIVVIPSDDAWLRDTGPTWRTGATTTDLSAVGWAFNAWGGGAYQSFELDAGVSVRLAEDNGACYVAEPLHAEGGAFSSDGEGTTLTTASVLIGRNGGISPAAIMARVKGRLGASSLIVLPRGLAADTDTGGHVDQLCVFASPGVVLLAWTDDPSHPEFEIVRAAKGVLDASVDARGRPLRVVLLPLPYTPLVRLASEATGASGLISGDAVSRTVHAPLASSYINFLVTDHVVAVPWFNDPADEDAVAILRGVFPGRRVVSMPAREVILGGGGLRCLSNCVPRVARHPVRPAARQRFASCSGIAVAR